MPWIFLSIVAVLLVTHLRHPATLRNSAITSTISPYNWNTFHSSVASRTWIPASSRQFYFCLRRDSENKKGHEIFEDLKTRVSKSSQGGSGPSSTLRYLPAVLSSSWPLVCTPSNLITPKTHQESPLPTSPLPHSQLLYHFLPTWNIKQSSTGNHN